MAGASENRPDIDMENADYKRQPDVPAMHRHVEGWNGFVCGIFRGGMFGLRTNQISILSAWQRPEDAANCYRPLSELNGYVVADHDCFTATVRPPEPSRLDREGFYVIRWIRMNDSDVDEYTQLCLETWPAFEAAGNARCYGVFERPEEKGISRLLMLTWYASMDAWETSRNLDPADSAKWSRRSEMELSHWADGARLASLS